VHPVTIAFYISIALAALAVCVGLTPATIALARRLGSLDVPGPRRMHNAPRPRIGGLAIAGAVFSVSGLAVVWAYRQGWVAPTQLPQFVTLGLAGGFIFAVGFIDDIRPIPSKFKALALVTAAAAVCGSGIRIDMLSWNSGISNLPLEWASWPVTIFWIVSVTVAIAFIDGMDGLAAGVVTIAGATLSASCVAAGAPAEAILPLALCGALLGFVLYNANPALLFMGDGGSLTIGFLIACASVLAAPAIGTPRGLFMPALALSVPLMDLAVTMFRRRFVHRQSLFSAEMGHIHHNLARLGLSQSKTVLILCGVSVMAVAIGEASLMARGWATLGGLSLLIPLLLGLFHAAGSVRLKSMITAVKRKRALDREIRRYDRAADDLQIRLRSAAKFSEWWQAVCDSAAALDFALLKLPLTHRDGRRSTLEWTPTHSRFGEGQTLHANVPIRDRRSHEPLRADVEVGVTSLESAGHRLAVFSRLMADYSVADLPDPAAVGPSGRWYRQTYPDVDRTISVESTPVEPVSNPQHPRVALVHDFLYVYAGAERVLEQMLEVFPEADLFALFDFLPKDERHFIRDKPVTTTFLQKLPFARSKHRHYLPLMPLAIEQLDVSKYDIVISSSHVAAKGVITGPDQLHICYCHSPVRYAWDLQHEYLAQAGLRFGPKAMLARAILHYIRNWDVRTSMGVDYFLANSQFVARRIEKMYRREASVIHPPVAVDQFALGETRGDYYVTLSRLVPYKRVDLIVQAFNRMPDRRLIVIGDGPEYHRIERIAGPNVRLMGYQPDDRVQRYLQMAKASLFAAEEDFGIVPVESMACGTPVITYGKGGATETVIDGQTGVFFHERNSFSIREAVERFEAEGVSLSPEQVREHAEQFSSRRFRREFEDFVTEAWERRRRRITDGNGARDEAEESRLSVSAEPDAEAGSAGATADGATSGSPMDEIPQPESQRLGRGENGS